MVVSGVERVYETVVLMDICWSYDMNIMLIILRDFNHAFTALNVVQLT